jgi:hypothetical protein
VRPPEKQGLEAFVARWTEANKPGYNPAGL